MGRARHGTGRARGRREAGEGGKSAGRGIRGRQNIQVKSLDARYGSGRVAQGGMRAAGAAGSEGSSTQRERARFSVHTSAQRPTSALPCCRGGIWCDMG